MKILLPMMALFKEEDLAVNEKTKNTLTKNNYKSKSKLNNTKRLNLDK